MAADIVLGVLKEVPSKTTQKWNREAPEFKPAVSQLDVSKGNWVALDAETKGVPEAPTNGADGDANIESDTTKEIDSTIKDDQNEVSCTTEARRVWRGRSHAGTEIGAKGRKVRVPSYEANRDADMI